MKHDMKISKRIKTIKINKASWFFLGLILCSSFGFLVGCTDIKGYLFGESGDLWKSLSRPMYPYVCTNGMVEAGAGMTTMPNQEKCGSCNTGYVKTIDDRCEIPKSLDAFVANEMVRRIVFT